MTEPASEGRVLALIEAEFRAADPGLTAQFDAFAGRGHAPGAARRWHGGRGHRTAPAKRLLAFLLVPLTVMAVLVALGGGRKAVTGRLPCAPLAAFGHPPLAGTVGCPAAGPARGPVPVPAHVRPAAGTGDRAFAAIAPAGGDGVAASFARAYHGIAGLGRRIAAAVQTWAARQGRAVRARICQSIPLPAGTACQ